MSAIEQCRRAAPGGHVLRCDGCASELVSSNSCRNRHCPKCQSAAANRWLDARQADLLPLEYSQVVFTLPAPLADLAYQNKAELYGLLFDVAAEVLQTIAADREHLLAGTISRWHASCWKSLLGKLPPHPAATSKPMGRPVQRLRRLSAGTAATRWSLCKVGCAGRALAPPPS